MPHTRVIACPIPASLRAKRGNLLFGRRGTGARDRHVAALLAMTGVGCHDVPQTCVIASPRFVSLRAKRGNLLFGRRTPGARDRHVAALLAMTGVGRHDVPLLAITCPIPVSMCAPYPRHGVPHTRVIASEARQSLVRPTRHWRKRSPRRCAPRDDGVGCHDVPLLAITCPIPVSLRAPYPCHCMPHTRVIASEARQSQSTSIDGQKRQSQ